MQTATGKRILTGSKQRCGSYSYGKAVGQEEGGKFFRKLPGWEGIAARKRYCIAVLLAALCLVFGWQQLYAAEATFTWTANTETNLAGYRIYYGLASRNYTQFIEVAKTETTATVKNLTAGQTYYFAATAYDTDNFESGYSLEVVWTAQTSNSPPVAADGALETTQGSAASSRLMATDPENDTLTYAIVSNGTLGAVVITNAATGEYMYIPNAMASGSDSFTYRVNDGSNDSNLATVSVLIHAPTANQLPQATIQHQASTASSFALNFDGRSSIDPDGEIIGYSWNFGDGATGSGPFVSHTYSDAGEYSVSLTVTDNRGATAQDVVVVSIAGEVANMPPVADLNATLAPIDSSVVLVDGSGSTDLDGQIVSYSWNFGDGEVGAGATCRHKYQITGRYSVTMIITDNDGGTTRKAVDVDVRVPQFAIETGEATIDGNWQWVPFSAPIDNPVVIATMASSNDKAAGVIRIADVQKTGFNIRFQNWEYVGSDEHGPERVGYIAMESGTFELENGIWIEAGRFTTDMTDSFEQRAFIHDFQSKPVVLTAVNTINDAAAIAGRIQNITSAGFDYRMQEQTDNTDPLHLPETVSYIAWEPSTGTINDLAYEVDRTQQAVTDIWFTLDFAPAFGLPPVVIADMESAADEDPADLRYQLLTAAGLQIKVDEEKSVNTDTSHLAESVGFIALGRAAGIPAGLPGDIDQDNDIDGKDLLSYINGMSSWTLEETAAQFGLIRQ